MYNYERHLNKIPAALKTARRAAMPLHDEDGEVIGQREAHDYAPAHGWILILDVGAVLKFHHDQTAELVELLEPNDIYATAGKLMATLYKVDPRRPKDNVRATKRIDAATAAQIESVIERLRT